MRIALLSFSPIADDGRVRRHADALCAAGHEVEAFGYSGRAPDADTWPIHVVAREREAALEKAMFGARLAGARLAPRAAALPAYWSFPEHRAMFSAASRGRFDVFHANDWRTLPIAARLAALRGAPYVYDSHEYGVEENVDRARWRLLFPSYIRQIERRYIGQASVVFTVADGIAALLARDYRLRARPLVIRNAPPYRQSVFRPPGECIQVLYHGRFNADRGLEPLVESVPFWRPEFHLTLRGAGAPGLERRLRDIAEAAGVTSRVRFVPPVDVANVVEAATGADIGIHPLAGSSNQIRFALPNKFFEYVMAGLAVCVSDLPEMANLVEAFQLGRTIASPTPEAIAAAINGFTSEGISTHKRRALDAAHVLSWEHEQATLINAYERLEAEHS